MALVLCAEVKVDRPDGSPGDDVGVIDPVSMLFNFEEDVFVVEEGKIPLMESPKDEIAAGVVGVKIESFVEGEVALDEVDNEKEGMVEDEIKLGEAVPPPTSSSKVYSM